MSMRNNSFHEPITDPLQEAIEYINTTAKIPESIINYRRNIASRVSQVFEAIHKTVIKVLGDKIMFVEHDNSDDVETDLIRYNWKHNGKHYVFRIGTDIFNIMENIYNDPRDYSDPEIKIHITEWRETDQFSLLFTTIFVDNEKAQISKWFNATDGIGYDVYIELDKLKEDFNFLLDPINQIDILHHIYEDD